MSAVGRRSHHFWDQFNHYSANEMNETAADWVRGLPMRWALGGVFLALVWLALVLFNGFTPPVDGYAHALVRVVLSIVLPLCVLGFVWGWSERSHLERAAAHSSSRFKRAITKYVSRQTGKSVFCGIAFTLFMYGLPFVSSFRPSKSPDDMQAYISPVLGGALLAMPIGIAVGVFSRRALKRKLGGQLSDGDADHSTRSATRPSNMSRLSQGGKVTADEMIVFPE